MSMTFVFFGEQYNGARVELFLPPYHNPSAAEIVSDGRVVFDVAAPTQFAVRMRDNTSAILRSGVCSPTDGFFDQANGNFSQAYWLVESAPYNLPSSSLSSMVPPLPQMTQDANGTDEFRLEALSLFTKGNFIAANGMGTYMKSAAGGVVTFEYEFKLLANQSAATKRVLKVDTIQAKVVSASGGSVQGIIINVIGNLMIGFMTDTVSASLESGVQAQIDAAIASQLAAANAPEQLTVTALKVEVNDFHGITIYPLAAVPGSSLCASEVESGSVKIRAAAQLRQLRAMRDQVLRGTPRGDSYIRLQQQHNRELVYLLIRHPHLLKQLDIVIRSGLKDFNLRSPGAGVLSEASARAGIELLEMIGKAASPELARAARALIPEVREFVGKPAASIFKR